MASAFSHFVVALALGQLQPWKTWPLRFWGISLLCSVLPDIDVIGFALGVPYEHALGHRGMTHSLTFAVITGFLVVRLAFPAIYPGSGVWWSLVMHFSLVTASHGILDAMTDGGLGIALFAPFDNTRYFFPWTPIRVSPIGIFEFFSHSGLEVLATEAIWVGIPVGVWLTGVTLYRWKNAVAKRI